MGAESLQSPTVTGPPAREASDSSPMRLTLKKRFASLVGGIFFKLAQSIASLYTKLIFVLECHEIAVLISNLDRRVKLVASISFTVQLELP